MDETTNIPATDPTTGAPADPTTGAPAEEQTTEGDAPASPEAPAEDTAM